MAIKEIVSIGMINEAKTHTQPRPHAARRRHLSPSSERYLIITFAPRENPKPSRGAFGYFWEIYTTACRRSSVCPAEYSCPLVMGTPAPERDLSQLSLLNSKTVSLVEDSDAHPRKLTTMPR